MKWIKFVCHIIYRTIYDGTLLRASALTYQTLLAVVPLLAIMLAIAKGFGLQSLLEQTLQQEFRDQKETFQYLLTFSSNTLDQLKEGTLAIVGLIALFFTVTRLFSSFEDALNAMWGITQRRAYLRMVSSHISLVIIAPLLFAFSSSITIFLTAIVKEQAVEGLFTEYTKTVSGGILHLIPYVTIALLFSLFLYILPTRKPRWFEALFAGILASIAYQILQSTYIILQLELTKISAIWGSFVALPLFLVWLWASWIIILMGGQLAVALHERLWNYKAWNLGALPDSIESPTVKIAYMEAIIEETKKVVHTHKECPSVQELSIHMQIPQRVLNPLLFELQDNHALLLSVGEESGSTLIAPLEIAENRQALIPSYAIPSQEELDGMPQVVQETVKAIVDPHR